MLSLRSILSEIESDALIESSLKRIEHWVNTKEIAGITAFRGKLQDVTSNTLMDIPEGEYYTKSQNKARNRDLKATLLKLGYGVTKVAGSYLEKGKDEVQEESYIVVNLPDDPNFKRRLLKLAEYYNQDSILYKPKDDENGYLIGTNNTDFPGFGVSISQGKFHKKVNATYMSRIGTQGFAFSKDDEDNPLQPHTSNTFQDRKRARINKMGTREIYSALRIETFDSLQNNSKYLCGVYARPIIEQLNKD